MPQSIIFRFYVTVSEILAKMMTCRCFHRKMAMKLRLKPLFGL